MPRLRWPSSPSKQMANLCARFMVHFFSCPKYSLTTSYLQAKLSNFIAYALHRMKLDSLVSFAALVLPQQLKAWFPTTHGSSGHWSFILTFTIEPTVMPPMRSASISLYGTPMPILCAENTTSPASSASPATPAGIVDLLAQITSSLGTMDSSDTPTLFSLLKSSIFWICCWRFTHH